jgi:hypothetical protein
LSTLGASGAFAPLATEARVVEAAEDTAVEPPEVVAEHSTSTASVQTSIGFFDKANSPEAEPGPVPTMGRGVERSLASRMHWGLHALGAEAALDCAPADDAPEALPCVSGVVIVGVEAARAGAATAVAEARRAGATVSGPAEANLNDLQRDDPASALCSRAFPSVVAGEAVPSCRVGVSQSLLPRS